MKKRTKAIGLLILFLFCACCSGCTLLSKDPIRRQDFMFDTVVTITIYDKTDEALLDGCMEMGRKYELLFSREKEGSDIWRINHAKGAPVEVSQETVSLLQTGLKYCAMSDGRYDITIGAVSQLWNFGADSPVVPDNGQIEQALKTVDYQGVSIDGNTVMLTVPGAQLDLGSIAKGYIADRMQEYLREQGVQSAIIDLGGNIYALGKRTDGTDFRVGIQSPFDQSQIGTVRVRDKSLVTSGVYQRCFTVDGKRYHHLLDATTGYPIENGLASVTIVSDRSVDGDALSTVLFCLGEEDGMRLAQDLGIEAVLVRDDGEILQTDGITLS